jgi:hypothetical protein
MNRMTIAHIGLSMTLTFPVLLSAQSSESAAGKDPDQTVKGATLPAGWTARPDAGGNAANIKFVTMEPGYHLTLGPATILYRKGDQVSGPFHTLATFHQMKKLEHPEGYGLFLGGRDLEGRAQAYTYFLVRGDGKFTIKRRQGEKVTQVTQGWQSHPAIKPADANGAATNLLEIDAKVDPKRVSFMANGKEVHSIPANKMETKGVVGLRVNHNLDVHVEGFAVHK